MFDVVTLAWHGQANKVASANTNYVTELFRVTEWLSIFETHVCLYAFVSDGQHHI